MASFLGIQSNVPIALSFVILKTSYKCLGTFKIPYILLWALLTNKWLVMQDFKV